MYRQSIQFPLKDEALRDDVHALGGLIGETLRDQGGEEYLQDWSRTTGLAAIQRREGDADRSRASWRRRTAGRPPTAATDLTRAFSLWFMTVNTAEKVHRVRRRRQYLNDSSRRSPAASPIASRGCSATA